MKKKVIFIIALFLTFVGTFGYLTRANYVNALETFESDGYILVANTNQNSDVINEQRYFDAGTTYKTSSFEEKIVFTDVNNEKVSVDTKNFVHYGDESLAGLSESVLMDTDSIDDNQISYYSISNKSVLTKIGNKYTTSNAGTEISFSNFLWKISAERYMVVSNAIELVVSDTSQQSFTNYLEIQYVDEGVVRLVNQDGTYSTISSDAYLELENGIRIYLGSKNVSDGENILMNMSQMVVDSDDNIEIIPDEEYKKENVEQPQIIVNATDGQDGIDANQGDQGANAEQGANGNNAAQGANGNNAANGKDAEEGADGANAEAGKPGTSGDGGNAGVQGNKGAAGTPGTVGDSGEAGQSATNSELEYIQADLAPTMVIAKNTDGSEKFEVYPYGVNTAFTFSSNDLQLNDTDNGFSYTIIRSSDSSIVWRRTFNPNSTLNENADNPLTADKTGVKTLKSDTQYTLVVAGSYLPEGSSTYVTSVLLTKNFTTDGFGLNLSENTATTSTITADIGISNKAIESISSFEVELYDEYMNLLSYDPSPTGNQYGILFMAENPAEYNYDGNVGDVGNKHSIIHTTSSTGTPVNPGSVPIRFTNLKSNTVYYAHVGSVTCKKDQDINIGTLPSGSFEFVQMKTLKVDPVVGVPELRISEKEDSIIVNPGIYVDSDGGIVKYIYKFYKVNENGEDELVYTTTQPGKDSFNVKMYDNEEESPNHIVRGNKYYCVASVDFDNNLFITNFDSLPSNTVVTSETRKWPVIEFDINTYPAGMKDTGSQAASDVKYNAGKTSPSIIDGKLTINDKQGQLIPSDAIITLELTAPDAVKFSSDANRNEYGKQTIKKVASEIFDDYSYIIPFEFHGLKQDVDYTLSVKTDSIYEYTTVVNGTTTAKVNNKVYSNLTLKTATVSTGKYLSLYVDGVEPQDKVDSSHNFETYLYFLLDENAVDKQNSYTTASSDKKSANYTFSDLASSLFNGSTDKITTQNLAIKSMTAIAIDVYGGTSTGVPDTTNRLNNKTLIIAVADSENSKSQFAKKYNFNNELYTLSFIEFDKDANLMPNFDTTGIVANDYKLFINDSLFDDNTLSSAINEYIESKGFSSAEVFLRIREAYDYTFGTGGYPVYKTNVAESINENNIIPIGNQEILANNSNLYIEDSIEDQWVKVTSTASEPKWPSEGFVFFDREYLSKIKESRDSGVRYLEPSTVLDDNNNPVNYRTNLIDSGFDKESIKESWSNIKTDTNVGVLIKGPTGWLSSYGIKVKYEIYDSSNNLITQSFDTEQEAMKATYLRSLAEAAEKAAIASNEGNPLSDTVIATIYADYNNFISNSGWISYDAGDELPRFVTYFGFENGSTGRTLNRGEDYTVELKLMLKDPLCSDHNDETCNINHKIFPQESEKPEIQNKHIAITYTDNLKETPTVSIIQYNGDTASVSGNKDSLDTFLSIISDPDNSIIKNNENIVIYGVNNELEGADSKKSVTTSYQIPQTLFSVENWGKYNIESKTLLEYTAYANSTYLNYALSVNSNNELEYSYSYDAVSIGKPINDPPLSKGNTIHTYIMDGKENKISIDATSYAMDPISTDNSNNANGTLLLLGRKLDGNYISGTNARVKIYSADIYADGTDITKQYVPSKKLDDGKLGLYDLINNTFITSSVGRDFIAGPVTATDMISNNTDYVSLEYITSDGTQYFDTGVSINKNTKVVVKAMFVDDYLFNGKVVANLNKLVIPMGKNNLPGDQYMRMTYKLRNNATTATDLWMNFNENNIASYSDVKLVNFTLIDEYQSIEKEASTRDITFTNDLIIPGSGVSDEIGRATGVIINPNIEKEYFEVYLKIQGDLDCLKGVEFKFKNINTDADAIHKGDETEAFIKEFNAVNFTELAKSEVADSDNPEIKHLVYIYKLKTPISFGVLDDISEENYPTKLAVAVSLLHDDGKYGMLYTNTPLFDVGSGANAIKTHDYYIFEDKAGQTDNVLYANKDIEYVIDDFNRITKINIKEGSTVLKTLNFYADGLNLIPKHVNNKSYYVTGLERGYVTPYIDYYDSAMTYHVEDDIGLNFAIEKIKLTGKGTLYSPKPEDRPNVPQAKYDLNIYIRKVITDTAGNTTGYSDWSFVKKQLLNSSKNYSLSFDNLEADTEYQVKVEGYFKRTDAADLEPVVIHKKGQTLTTESAEYSFSFKTKNVIAVDEVSSNFVNVYAGQDDYYPETKPVSRQTKYLKIDIAFKDAHLIDFYNPDQEAGYKGVKQLSYTVKKGTDSVASSTPLEIKGSDIFAYLQSKYGLSNSDADLHKKMNFVYTYYLPFKPEMDLKHELHKKYGLDFALEYSAVNPGASSTSMTDEHSLSQKELKPWFSNNAFNFMISYDGVTENNANGVGVNHFIKYTINGNDTKRIITGNSADGLNVTYVAELRSQEEFVVVGGETKIIDKPASINITPQSENAITDNGVHLVSIKTGYYDEYNNYVEETTPHDVAVITSTLTGTALNPKIISCNDLKPSTTYYLRIYANIDGYNKDIDCLDLSNDEEINNFVNNISQYKNAYNTEYYMRDSVKRATGSTQNITVQSMNLLPTMKMIDFAGINLPYVDHLSYKLVNITTGVVTDRYYNHEDTILNWKSGWSSNIYHLRVPELDDPSANYHVIVNFYGKSTDGDPDSNYLDGFENEYKPGSIFGQ